MHAEETIREQIRPGWLLSNGMPGQILTLWPEMARTLQDESDLESIRTEAATRKVSVLLNTSALSRGRLGGARTGSLASVSIHVRLRLIASDGSWISLEADGEAMDDGDRAVEKATARAVATALRHSALLPLSIEPSRMSVPGDLSAVANSLLDRIDDTNDPKVLGELMAFTAELPFFEQDHIRVTAVRKWTKIVTGGRQDQRGHQD